jgi:phosphatidyl-myo-inositol dimannoside synthase
LPRGFAVPGNDTVASQLLLTYDFPPMGGGIARWMGELARHYPAQSLIVSTGRLPLSEEIDRDYPNPVDRLGIPSRRLRTLPGTIRWSRRVVALAQSHRLEFVWCGNVKPAAYPAWWTRSRLGVPYGVILHGGDLLILRRQIGESRLKRVTARALLGNASVLVTNSSWTANQCRGLLETLEITGSNGWIQTVPLGTDPAFFKPGVDSSAVAERYRLEQRRWIITVARLTPHKGMDTVLQVLSRLGNEYPDLGYLVIGSGSDEERARLEALAQTLGIAARVRFLSGVPDADLPALYNCAMVYLGMSRVLPESVEGFGISLLEASACGLPVLASRRGGIQDAIHHGETGLLVDPDQLDEICSALRALLDDRPLAARLGVTGRKSVEQYFNWNRVTSDMLRIGREHGTGVSSTKAG